MTTLSDHDDENIPADVSDEHLLFSSHWMPSDQVYPNELIGWSGKGLSFDSNTSVQNLIINFL